MHRTKTLRRGLLCLLALGLVAAGCGRDDDADDTTDGSSGGAGGDAALVADPAECVEYVGDAGVTDTEIRVGTFAPQSGPVAAFGRPLAGMRAYFEYVNANGGVLGRQVTLFAEDDQYNPALTAEVVPRLVEDDDVFAIVGGIGTPNNLAVRDYLAEMCVPNFAVASGSPFWGDVENYPWLISGLPNYATETQLFVDYLVANQPDAKVAVIYQNDDFGKPYLEALENGIEGTNIEIVASESYDITAQADTTAQVTTLANSGADAFLVAATSTCPAVLRNMPADWQPTTYVSLVCTSRVLMGLAAGDGTGVMSARATYDPADPANHEHAGVALFRTEGPNYGLTAADLDDANVSTGWGWGELFVRTLEAAGEADRAAFMNAAWSQDGGTYGLLVDGIEPTTNGFDDPWAIEQLQLIQWDGTAWVPQGDVQSFEGESLDLASPMGG